MKLFRAFCECGKRIVSDISEEHLKLLASEHAAYHTRQKRQRTPVMNLRLTPESRIDSGHFALTGVTRV